MFRFMFSTTTALAAALMLLAGFSAQALEQKPILTLKMAKKMAEACEALQQAQGFRPVNIAIYDDGGNLKLFRRQENAFLGSILVANMKATTSSNFPFSSRRFGELAYGKDGEPGPVPGIAELSGFAAFPGGLPIITESGAHIGSIGVSGASGDEDEQCSQAGIDAIGAMLQWDHGSWRLHKSLKRPHTSYTLYAFTISGKHRSADGLS